jgi:hypothetical protein
VAFLRLIQREMSRRGAEECDWAFTKDEELHCVGRAVIIPLYETQNTDSSSGDFQTPDPQYRFEWQMVGRCVEKSEFSPPWSIAHILGIYDFEKGGDVGDSFIDP